MFIINGKKGENVIIDDHISLTIVENSNGQLVLEIDSPKEIHISNGENLEISPKKS